MRCYSYDIRSCCYLPGSKGRAAFRSRLKPNDSWEAALLQGPESRSPIRAKPSDTQKYFLFVHGHMEKPRHTLLNVINCSEKPPTNSHAVKKEPWLADTFISTCKINWPLGEMKYLQNYFVLYLPVMIFTVQLCWFRRKEREGWEVFHK